MRFLNLTHGGGGQATLIRQALRLRIPMAIATMAFAFLGLGANLIGPAALSGFFAGSAVTHPLTAFCLFELGFWALRMTRFGQASTVKQLMCGLVAMICAARVMGACLSAWTGAPLLSVFGPIGPFTGHFSVEAAMAIGAFSTAALLRQNLGRLGMGLMIVGLGVVYNTVVETVYGVTFFQGEVSVFTLLGLGCAATAMLSIYVHRPFVRVSMLMGDLGSQTRMMAAAAVAFPLLAGLILNAVKPLGNAGFPVEAAMTSAVTWALLVTLLGTSARLESTAASRRRAEREIAMQSRIDPLTKALNRFGMMEAMEGAWLNFRSTGALAGLILVDLDYFKRLNDTFGHDMADDVLTRVSATLQPHLRDTDALGRWGGGEFMILFRIKQHSDMAVIASRLQRAFEHIDSPFGAGLDGTPAQITASFGLSEMIEGDHGPADAVTRADIALAWAKEARDRKAGRQFPAHARDTITPESAVA